MPRVIIDYNDDGTLSVSVGTAKPWRALSVAVSADSGARTVTVEHLLDDDVPLPEASQAAGGFNYLSGKAE